MYSSILSRRSATLFSTSGTAIYEKTTDPNILLHNGSVRSFT